MLRRIEVSRFALVYVAVVGAMYLAGVANSWLVMRTAPTIPYPLASALTTFGILVAVLVAGVLALAVTYRRNSDEVVTAGRRPGGRGTSGLTRPGRRSTS